MDAGLDTGDILLQRETPIGHEETAVELMDRLAVLGAELVSETLGSLDSIEPVKQDGSKATLAPLMSKDDGKIDWGLNADEISRRVRGFQPFPKSFTSLGDSKVTIWKCKEIPDRDSEADPGTVLTADPTGIEVACGSGTSVLIEELQMEGKRRMSSSDLLNGYQIEPGERFGN
jgi:methionyl-tRNA formyltransferase